MRTTNRVVWAFIVLSVFHGVGAVSLRAQDREDIADQPVVSRYDTMKSVKDEISALIIENKQLEERYSELKIQWRLLQIQQEHITDEADEIGTLSGRRASTMALVEEELDKFENKQQPAGNENRYVSGEFMDYGEEFSLLELRLEDLQYQHRELELELKMLKVQNQDQERDSLSQAEQNRTSLQAVLQREHQLQELIARKQEDLRTAPQQIPALEKENKELEESVLALEKKKEFKERELAIWKDKHTLKERSLEENLSKVEKEKTELTTRVEKLRNEHNQLSDTVAVSLGRQERKNELIQGIIKYDQENQQLQSKIDEMSGKLKSQE